MKGRKHSFAILLIALTVLPGCALLGGGKPAQLYRFGSTPAPGVPLPPPIGATVVMLSPVRFGSDVGGDRILAVRGSEALYIAGIRWSAPASSLFERALRDCLETQTPAVAVADRRDGAMVDRILQVSVDRFEARYADVSPPTVTIDGHAEMIDARTRLRIGTLHFSANRPATGNAAQAIVGAFDGATADAASQLASWVVGLPRAMPDDPGRAARSPR